MSHMIRAEVCIGSTTWVLTTRFYSALLVSFLTSAAVIGWTPTASALPQSLEIDGIRIAYLEAGAGPLVLLLHGFPDDANTFEDLLVALADGGFHAVAPFLRGYYPSGIPDDDDYSGLTLGRDVLALIEALGESEAVVVGHDWGASAGYAAANLEPAKIRRLVALGIPHPRELKPTPAQIWRARHFLFFQMPWAEWGVRRHDFAYVDRLYQRWSPEWSVPQDQRRRIKRSFEEPARLSAALGFYRAARRDLLRGSTRRVLRGLVWVPTLAIAGRSDGVIRPSVFTAAAKHFKGGYEVYVVDGAGHFMHREQPARVAAKILEFVR